MMYPLGGAQSRLAQRLFCAAWQVAASYSQQLTNPQQQQHGSLRQPDSFFFCSASVRRFCTGTTLKTTSKCASVGAHALDYSSAGLLNLDQEGSEARAR